MGSLFILGTHALFHGEPDVGFHSIHDIFFNESILLGDTYNRIFGIFLVLHFAWGADRAGENARLDDLT